jgi:hypothetical protein
MLVAALLGLVLLVLVRALVQAVAMNRLEQEALYLQREVERVRQDLVLAQARLQVAQVEQNRESGRWKGAVE